MAIRIVRLGSPRKKSEGIRIGTVRYPPRGVPRKLYSRLDFYDVWLPELSPSASLQKAYKNKGTTETSWRALKERFRKELGKPPAARIVRILAALSRQANFSIGCYCSDEHSCHRSVLREVLSEEGADVLEG